MPYDASIDQYSLGYAPTEQNFDANKQSPKLSDAFRWIARHASTNSRIQIVAVGKMYGRGSNTGKRKFSGITANVTFAELEATATSAGLTGKAVTHGGGGFSTEEKIKALFRTPETPEKVTGLYFRILD